MMDAEETPSAMLRGVQGEIPHPVESRGEISACPREASAHAESGNLKGAWIRASDALEGAASLGNRLPGMSVSVAEWMGGGE